MVEKPTEKKNCWDSGWRLTVQSAALCQMSSVLVWVFISVPDVKFLWVYLSSSNNVSLRSKPLTDAGDHAGIVGINFLWFTYNLWIKGKKTVTIKCRAFAKYSAFIFSTYSDMCAKFMCPNIRKQGKKNMFFYDPFSRLFSIYEN